MPEYPRSPFEKQGRIISPKVTGDDVDMEGAYALRLQNIADLAAKGPGYWFDAVNDAIDLGTDSNFNMGLSDYSMVADINIELNTAADRILGSGGFDWIPIYLSSGGILKTYLDASSYQSSGNANVADGVHHNIGIIVDRDVAAYFYIDGTQDGSNASITSDVSYDITGEHLYIGNEIGLSFGVNGSILRMLLFNLALTALEYKALSSGAPVPYKYIGASQTDILNGWDFTSGWNSSNTTVNDADTFTVDVSQGTLMYNAGVVPGKRYKCRIAGTAAGTISQLFIQSTTSTYKQNISGTFDVSFEFTADGDRFQIRGGGTGQVDITTFELTQIGCVGQWEPDSIMNGQWHNKNPNFPEGFGTVSGALATNLPAAHNETFKHLVAITGDTTFSSVVPAGYILESLILVNSGVGALVADLGTTADAHDVFQNQNIAASGITNILISKMFSESAAQTLYLSDESTPGWTDVSLTATLLMKKVV